MTIARTNARRLTVAGKLGRDPAQFLAPCVRLGLDQRQLTQDVGVGHVGVGHVGVGRIGRHRAGGYPAGQGAIGTLVRQ